MSPKPGSSGRSQILTPPLCNRAGLCEQLPPILLFRADLAFERGSRAATGGDGPSRSQFAWVFSLGPLPYRPIAGTRKRSDRLCGQQFVRRSSPVLRATQVGRETASSSSRVNHPEWVQSSEEGRDQDLRGAGTTSLGATLEPASSAADGMPAWDDPLGPPDRLQLPVWSITEWVSPAHSRLASQ